MNETDAERQRRFNELFRARRGDVVAFCGWRADTASDAQDALAEVFLIAWRRLDEVPDGDAARVWLYATARRVIANQRRSRRRRSALRDRLAIQPDGGSAEVFAPGSPEAIVHAALRRLRPADREVLLLAEWENLTPAQIGEVVGCLAVTARGRLHRARFRFRVEFEELQSRGRAARGAHGTHGAQTEGEDDHAHVERTSRAQARQPAF